ncbi:hypothetical protein ACXJY6_18725 [Vibrio sp. RC27]
MTRKSKRQNNGRFAGLPIWLLESMAYVSLPPLSKALLFELAGQYNGRNNGYLSLTREDLKRRGYTTPASTQKAIQCLLNCGFLSRTIDGGIHRGKHACHLYSINWQPSDELLDRPFQNQPMEPLAFKDLLSESGREPMLIRSSS